MKKDDENSFPFAVIAAAVVVASNQQKMIAWMWHKEMKMTMMMMDTEYNIFCSCTPQFSITH